MRSSGFSSSEVNGRLDAGSMMMMQSDSSQERLERLVEEGDAIESSVDERTGWFSDHFSRGGMGRQRYHPYEAKEVPYWVSYSHGALNW
jgi:hypothetical protein